MRKFALVAGLLLLGMANASFASEAGLQQIFDNPQKYDGKKVVLEGEVVGVAVKAGAGYFIQLNQDPYAQRSLAEGGKFSGSNISVAVYLEPEEFKKIKNFGNYHVKGDLVRIKGVFHAACSKHDGETDIHAFSLEIIKRGYKIKHNFNAGFAILSATVFLTGFVFFLVFSRLTKRVES